MTATLLARMLARLQLASEADWCGATNEVADAHRDEAKEHYDWLKAEMGKMKTET